MRVEFSESRAKSSKFSPLKYIFDASSPPGNLRTASTKRPMHSTTASFASATFFCVAGVCRTLSALADWKSSLATFSAVAFAVLRISSPIAAAPLLFAAPNALANKSITARTSFLIEPISTSALS
jgi:hypothetical protein